MRNRSRRGSMDCILEDTPQSPQPISGKPSRRASNTAAGGGARRRSSDGRKASGSARGAGSSRRGSSANEPASAPLVGSGAFVSSSADTFNYWLQVQVYPPVSAGFTRNLSPHSAMRNAEWPSDLKGRSTLCIVFSVHFCLYRRQGIYLASL